MIEEPPVGSATVEGFDLSPQQRRLWSLGTSLPEVGWAGVVAVAIEGELDRERLATAVELAVARHEILRTRFRTLPGMSAPLQVVGEAGVRWLADRELPAAGGEPDAEALASALDDLRRWDGDEPPLAALVARLDPGRNSGQDRGRRWLLLGLPALCADARTLADLAAEVARAYGAAGGGGELGGDPLQYADYAAWQNDLLETEEAAAEREGWRRQGLAATLPLPLPFESRVAGDGFAPRSCPLQLPAEVLQVPGLAPGPFLLGCWQVLAWHLSGQPERVMSIRSEGRGFEELEGALGPFARHLPLSLRLAPSEPFAAVARRAWRAFGAATAAEHAFAWEKLAEWSGVEEGGLHPRLAFALEELPEPTVVGGLRFSVVRRWHRGERCDLELAAVRRGAVLEAEVRFDGARFEGRRIERLAVWLGNLARRAAARPERPVADLEVLDEAEREAVVVAPNRTAAELAGGRCLHRLVAAQTARTPDAVAVRSEEGTLTYAELGERVRRLAGRLRESGVGPEARVGIFAERSPAMVVGLLAILEAGGAYVPLDPDHPAGRLATMLAESAPPVVLAQPHLASALPPHPGVTLPIAATGDAEEVREGAAVGSVGSGADPCEDNLAYVLYTSGSTGRPKGVMVSHRAIVNRVLWMQDRFPLSRADRVLQKTPLSFDASIWEIFCPLAAGAELVLARPGGHRDTAYLARATAELGITVLQLVPSLVGPFLDQPGVERAGRLRRLFCGGEELTADLRDRFFGLFGEADLHNLYGPTEAAIDAAFWVCRRGTGGRSVPIGHPIANLELQLLGPGLVPVPPEVPGELFLGGTGLARGYLGQPARTAERFLPHPFAGAPGGRLYRTGDLARRLPGGEVEYLGRADRQVKVRGVRIEPEEVEAVLAEHPEVRRALVVVDRGGERSDPRLVAYVVPRAEASPGAAELRRHLAARLPSAWLPALFVVLRSLPLKPNGKVDFAALPPPEAEGSARSAASAAPRTPTEEVLAGAWEELLGVSEVGIHDDFFALGGHSLLATQLVSRLRRLFGVEVLLRELFRTPTVAGAARLVDDALKGEAGVLPPPVVPVARQGRLPLSFSQQRLWFLEELKPGTPLYNIPDAFGFGGLLRIAAVEAALSEIVRRHEVLRTVFRTVRGEPEQVVLDASPRPLPLVDLTALPPEERDEEAERCLAAAGDRPFDLARGPLLRVVLVRLGERRHAVGFTVHHIASDAWSVGVMIRELKVLYEAALGGGPSPLAELGLQYADFAAWQRSYLQGEVLEAQLAYWRRQLAGAPPLLELPADRPRPEKPSYRGRTHPVLLPAAVADALRRLARSRGATLFMALVAVFQLLLRHLAGRDDIAIGTDVANRNREEVEGLVGFFINQIVLRTDLGGDPTFLELLERVRSVTLGAYAHQDVPFDLVVDGLGVERSLRHPPLFQVKLFLENTPAEVFSLPDLRATPLEADVRVAKLDLVLAFWEKPEGLSGWINYNTDLFDPPRMERLVRQLATLAGWAAARPEARLSELVEILDDMERKARTMEKKQLRDSSFKAFKAVKPQAMTLPAEGIVERTYLAQGQTLPLVLRPRIEDVDLADWSAANADELETDLLEHGAILFRGFGIDTPEAFERFARTLSPDLFNENGEHPRESVSGNVYTPVFYPPDQRLLWHNENSFNWSWPRKIFFCCAQPAARGGETPIVDSRRVYRELDPEIRRRFEEKGVRYQRSFGAGLGLPWTTVFQTDSPEEVEARCRATRTDFDWRDPNDPGRLRTRARRPAVIGHPTTGEKSWFNQAQHFHVSCLDPETRRSMESLFADEDLPRQCHLGDGTPISDADMRSILDLYERLQVVFPWQKGDVLMVDNVLCAHGRNPFQGERKILVSMGDMRSYDDDREV